MQIVRPTFGCALGVVLVFVTLHVQSAVAGGERRYALIIGNNIGKRADDQLRFAERDALRFASVMRRYGGLTGENTIMLLNDSRAAIRRALLALNGRIRTENDSAFGSSVLIVYYSGHADAEGLHPGPHTLSYGELRAMLKGSPATFRLLILDGCRSGGVTKVKGGRQTEDFNISARTAPAAEGVVMISSSAAGEDSHESEALKASFFTHHFVNALLGAADEDRNNEVTLGEAYSYAYRNTLQSSGRSTQLQHPTYSYDLKGRVDFTMTHLARRNRSKGARLLLSRAGTYLIYRNDERRDITAELRVRHRGASLAIAPGKYLLQLRSNQYYLEYAVDVEPGGVVDIARRKGRRVAYARLVRKGAPDKRSAHSLYTRFGGRGELFAGQGPATVAAVGYQLDLRALSVGARLRFSQTPISELSPSLRGRHRDWGMGVTAQRYIDFDRFSIGIGMSGEIVLYQQTFSGSAHADKRWSIGASFRGLITLERPLSRRLLLAAEAGPVSYWFRKATLEAGVERGERNETVLTGWASIGLGYLF
ncbi:MAG: caspase family protein [Proteobacteria bacterium]|nr:caspase family protein [Pseudomonadota bacterium]